MNSDGWLLVGIDIAAKTFTAAWGHSSMEIGSAQTFEQNPVVYRGLISELRVTGCPATRVQVVIEATGSYWTQVARSLYEAGFQVHVINPKQAYHYAQAKLQLTKTDAIDARLLAEMAASLTTATPWHPPRTSRKRSTSVWLSAIICSRYAKCCAINCTPYISDPTLTQRSPTANRP